MYELCFLHIIEDVINIHIYFKCIQRSETEINHMISDQVNIINFVKLDRNCVYMNSGLTQFFGFLISVSNSEHICHSSCCSRNCA